MEREGEGRRRTERKDHAAESALAPLFRSADEYMVERIPNRHIERAVRDRKGATSSA